MKKNKILIHISCLILFFSIFFVNSVENRAYNSLPITQDSSIDTSTVITDSSTESVNKSTETVNISTGTTYTSTEVITSVGVFSTTNKENKNNFPLKHKDSSCEIEITREWYGPNGPGAWCYVAHINLSDYSRLKKECANGFYNKGKEKTSHASMRAGAIFTVNGDHSEPEEDHPVMAQRVVYNDKLCNAYAVYSSQTGVFAPPEFFGVSNLKLSETTDKISDTFHFLPPYLKGDEIFKFGGDKSRAQRTFVGTNGNPGELWIVVSEGRMVDGISAGLTYEECAMLLREKGCNFGVPLDGGGSSTMVFKGKVLNHLPGNKERKVVDFLHVI